AATTRSSSGPIHEEDDLCRKEMPRLPKGDAAPAQSACCGRDLLLFVGRFWLHALPRITQRLRGCRPRRFFRGTLVLLVDLLGIAPLLRLGVFLGMSGGDCQ